MSLLQQNFSRQNSSLCYKGIKGKNDHGAIFRPVSPRLISPVAAVFSFSSVSRGFGHLITLCPCRPLLLPPLISVAPSPSSTSLCRLGCLFRLASVRSPLRCPASSCLCSFRCLTLVTRLSRAGSTPPRLSRLAARVDECVDEGRLCVSFAVLRGRGVSLVLACVR